MSKKEQEGHEVTTEIKSLLSDILHKEIISTWHLHGNILCPKYGMVLIECRILPRGFTHVW